MNERTDIFIQSIHIDENWDEIMWPQVARNNPSQFFYRM